MKKDSALSAALWLSLCQLVFAGHVWADTPAFDVPPGELRAALDTYAKQAGVQILYRLEDVENLYTDGVHGRVDAEAALGVLLKGTPLRVHRDASGALAISRTGKASGNSSPPPGQAPSGRTPAASPTAAAQTRAALTSELPLSPEDSDTRGRLDEVVVTGTHIRGAGPPAGTVYVYTRDDIDQSGAATVQSFIQKLPQNFNGGASDSTIGSVAGGGNAANAVGGTGVNLRGLGNDSTLVLIDGRRVAPGNTYGNFVDISLIPLSAVERIEIVTDGASAIYGSDAVGGVVNFIMRRDFDGAETRVQYGTDGRGGTHETEVGQTVGHDWNSGSALLSYEYSDRTPLTGADRTITQSLVEPFTLLPDQVRHGVFGSAQQNLANDVQAFAEGTYSHRATSSDVSSPFFTMTSPATITTYSGTLGMRIDLPRSTQAEVSASYSASDTRATQFDGGALADDQKVRTGILSLDGKVDGLIGSIGSGPIRYAVGGQYRRETFDDNDFVGITDFNPSRDIAAGFLELRVPIVGPPSPMSEASRLELILADRGEHYSDFGSTNNPQIGLLWAPLLSLSVHGQFGTSFHAPLLSDLNPVPSQVIPYPESDPRTGATTNSLIEFGGNPELQPERAHTWSIGLDIHPTELPGLRANLGYFNIRFTNRITNAQAQGVDLTNALNLENILGPQIVQRNPSQALVQALAATPGYADLFGTGINLATIGAIVDSRQLNLSTQRTDGADFSVSYGTETFAGRLETGITGTYLFSFDNQFTSGSPMISALDTVYNPVDLKMRGHAALTRGPWSAALFVNYINSYKDNRAVPTVQVASWTTADVTLRYAPTFAMGPFSNSSVALSVTNLANRNPPYAAPQYPASYGGAAFDGANASLLGRFISLQVSTRW
jgi:outer membrane receptor protein involved in Fe transport